MAEKENEQILLMREALLMADEAYDSGEVPVGCVFALDGKVVARGRNRTNEMMNATMHAEMVVLREIEFKMDTSKLDLYVTVEPCLMCAAALRQIGIKAVFYGCGNDKFGGCGTIFNLHNDESDYQPYQVHGSILEKEAIMQLRRFYIRENDHGILA